MNQDSLTIASLEKVAQMTEEMEKRYEERIEILQLQVEDAYGMIERYIIENEKFAKSVNDNQEWNKIYIAMYLLLFVYGMIYGVYFKSHQQEL